MFYGITDLPAFILGTILIVLLPGPNSLYLATVSSRSGVRAGFRAAAGIFTGDLILMTLAATGAASLLHRWPAVFTVLQVVGAAYLAWLGADLLRNARQRWHSEAIPAAVSGEASPRPFRTALTISLMNPKAIFFYIAFFIQFVAPDYPRPWLSFLILGTVVQVCSMVYLLALIYGGSRLAGTFRQRPRLSACGLAGVGILFIAFALRLAWSGLS
ncbi:leucine efflux protein [Fluviicoccus keumensis]|uniref:Leucine efflux protein n=1 Tax=Fluviicoccus keumensis TaxID=1435465 RepID=A0A4Q7ZA04_9GAMM|nr:leucine efflux protein LeuE [Fluviicoccus keumensis]RZU47402.1 leucine efflux protein [Fluviicoccus keumensis]